MIARERMRRLTRLVPWPTLLLAAACGGGDDKGPAGPGGEPTVSYELAALGQVGLPANVHIDGCTPTLFKSGYLLLTEDDGWFLRLEVSDEDGDWGYEDEGEVDEDGAGLWLVSELSGSAYQAAFNGGQASLLYDWCYDGAPDIQLVFDR